MKYSNIKSPFIKKQLQNTTWDNRIYIDDLVKLHRYMTDGIKSWIAASLFSELTYKYRREYLELIKEDIDLNPNEKRIKIYPKLINDMIQRNKKIRQWKKEDLRKEKLMRKDWLSAGGKNNS